jgi:hypothetical protein
MPSIKQAIKISDDTFSVTDVEVDIVNAPADCDWSRWGMLDDRKSTRMYCFKKDTKGQIYQFLFDGKSYTFEETISLSLEGLDDDLHNTEKIGMLSTPNFEEAVGFKDKEAGKPFLPIPNNYHVYLQKVGNPQHLYQFIWKEGTTNFMPNGITRDWFGINDFPADTDWKRWTITYDSNHYQLSLPAYVVYAFKENSNSELYFGRYGAVGDQDDGEGGVFDVYSYNADAPPIYEEGEEYYGVRKGGNLKIIGLAEDFEVTDLSMVFDGINTYLYLLTDQS